MTQLEQVKALVKEQHPERIVPKDLCFVFDFMNWLINGEYQTHLGRDEEGWIWYAHVSHKNPCDACIARTRENALWALFKKTHR